MTLFNRTSLRALTMIATALAIAPAVAVAQTDEIQVYDGAIADPGTLNLTWHNNFSPRGSKEPGFPGGLINDKTLNGVTEWAWGVNNWFEAGLYLPLYSITKDHGPQINGGKIRLLFAEPHADDHKFIYAINFEFSLNSKHWDARRYTSEIRPILGVHLGKVDFIVNPILDNSYYGGFKSLDFAPATRLAYNYTKDSAFAVEEYADIGPLRDFAPTSEQFHQLYGVYDRKTKIGEFEAGIGFGLTSASDKLTLKFMYSRDLFSRKKAGDSGPAASSSSAVR